LVEEAIAQARRDGAERLYVSATPSESAVGFYLEQGFAPVKEPLPELYELEPEDIHMVKFL
jgi:N-acetylglutamate synthase-like GNAT family acetyltransferase